MTPALNFARYNMARRFAHFGAALFGPRALQNINSPFLNYVYYFFVRSEISAGFIICSYSLTLADKL